MKKRALEVCTVATLVAGLTACESDNTDPHPLPTRPKADTVVEAQTKLDKGQPVTGFVIKATVDPKGGVEGKTTAYNPIRLEGDQLWYVACEASGRVVLKELTVAPDSHFQSIDGDLRSPQPYDVDRLPEEFTDQIVRTNAPCGIAVDRGGYADPYNQIGYIGTPKGD